MRLFDRLFAPNINKFESQGNIEALSNLVNSNDRGDLRLAAVEALSRIGGDEVIQPLVTSLADTDCEVSLAAEEALTDLGTAPSAALVAALGSPGADSALKILLNLGQPAVEYLAGAYKNQEDEGRRQALDGLVELDTTLDNDETREIFFRTLLAALGDRSPKNRVFAATQLETVGEPKASRGLAAQLKDGDESVRLACRRALAAIGEPAVPNLLDALADRNLNSRRIAAELLGEVCCGDVEIDSRRIALSALTDHASDSNAGIAAAVQSSLKRIPSETVIMAQLELLADPDRSDHEEIQEFLDLMLEHCTVAPEFNTRTADRMSALGFPSSTIDPE